MEIARPHAPTIRDIIRRYYTVWGMYSFAGGFLFGVYPIFLRSRGLSQLQINSVLATYFLVLFLTDVPTGAFADLLGRRRSFVLGAFLRVSAFLLYFVAHHYYVFIIAESIDGIGTTFGNGAIDAWGVDALDDAGYDGLKDRLFSRISQLTHDWLHGVGDDRRVRRRRQHRVAVAARRSRLRDLRYCRRIPDARRACSHDDRQGCGHTAANCGERRRRHPCWTRRAYRPHAECRERNHGGGVGAVLGLVAGDVQREPRRWACGSSAGSIAGCHWRG